MMSLREVRLVTICEFFLDSARICWSSGWALSGFEVQGYPERATLNHERVRAKGELARKRTIIQETGGAAADAGAVEMPAVDVSACVPGRVLRVHGLYSVVQTDDGRQFRCTVRR